MSGGASQRASGSPGIEGYALAIGVSLLVFGLEMPLAQAAIALAGRASWAEVPSALATGFAAIAIGLVPAVIIGPAGACVVHLMTWGAAEQAWHVFAAAFVGLSTGALLLGFHSLPMAVMLGVATGVGRLAAVPLARERARRGEPETDEADGGGWDRRSGDVDYGPGFPPDDRIPRHYES